MIEHWPWLAANGWRWAEPNSTLEQRFAEVAYGAGLFADEVAERLLPVMRAFGEGIVSVGEAFARAQLETKP